MSVWIVDDSVDVVKRNRASSDHSARIGSVRRLALAFLILAALPACPAEPLRARHGMVVAREPGATRVGLRVLQSGGNAIDAAVAVGFALAVTHPSAGNLGGGGFMLLRLADGRVTFLDFRERAPRAASRDMYLDANGKVTGDSLVGYRASGVPGTVRGLDYASRKYGKKPWAEVVRPAVRSSPPRDSLFPTGPPSRSARALTSLQPVSRFESHLALQREILRTGTGFEQAGAASALSTHLMAEAMRRFFADRAAYLGDADFARVPLLGLLDPAYVAKRRASIDPNRATPSSEILAGVFADRESTQTTHYSIADAAGNIAAVTYTLNGSYGSSVTATGLGFLLNNEMDDFAPKPGEANAYGLIQGEANAIQPGKAPLSSMAPTFVLREGRPFLALEFARRPDNYQFRAGGPGQCDRLRHECAGRGGQAAFPSPVAAG